MSLVIVSQVTSRGTLQDFPALILKAARDQPGGRFLGRGFEQVVVADEEVDRSRLAGAALAEKHP